MSEATAIEYLGSLLRSFCRLGLLRLARFRGIAVSLSPLAQHVERAERRRMLDEEPPA